MKQMKIKIRNVMMCLLVSISMMMPTISTVQANETYSQLLINIKNTEYTLTFQCMSDTNTPLPCFNHNEIELFEQEENTSQSLLENNIPEYTLNRIEDVNSKVSIYAFRYDLESTQLQYKETEQSEWTPWTASSEDEKTRSVNFIYSEIPFTDLAIIDGQDTRADGITMNLFNYTVTQGASSNNINYQHPFKFVNYGAGIKDDRDWNLGGMLRQGLVESKLENGYPKLTVGKTENLAYLFDPAVEQIGKVSYTDVNKLLKKTADGSYVYDSQENFAMYHEKTNEFILSEEVGAPNRDTDGFRVGNFFPFNTIASSNGFRTFNDRAIYNVKNPDFHFGMTMEANFLQPKDGIYHDQDMIFDFSGDDDVWVFIDGVLVLDLGGIHPAQSGSINFANGDVIVNGEVSTTIKNQFEQAGVSASFDGSTFADFTEHSIKFFYLERGAGASNCKLRINLPIMPKNGFAVSKQVSNLNEAVSFNEEYTFRAYVDQNNDSVYSEDELLRNTNYQIGNQAYTTNEDGSFTLKAGEMAEFKEEWVENLKFKVEEFNVDQSRYQDVIITANNQIVGSYDANTGIATSGSLTIGQHVLVSFDNKVSDTLTSSFEIQKSIKNGNNTDAFQMITKINGELYHGTYTVNDGTNTRSETATNGIITIKQNETAIIEQLLADTTFEVTEALDSVNADYQKYSNDVEYEFEMKEGYGVHQPVSSKDGASGSILQGKTTLLHVTNTLIYGKLQIVKQIDTANFANGDPIFTFQIERLDKEGSTIGTIYRSVRFDQTLDAQTITIEQLPLGEYRVRELSSLRYLAEGEVTKTDTINQADQTIVFPFKNNVVNDQYYSHTDIVSNQVQYKKDEQGTITEVIIKQDTLETPTE